MRNKTSSATEAIPVLPDWPAYESHKLLEPDRVKLTSSIQGGGGGGGGGVLGLYLDRFWVVVTQPQKVSSIFIIRILYWK